MLREALEELGRRQGQALLAALMGVILPVEGHLILLGIVRCHAGWADGYPVDVTPQVAQEDLRRPEWWLDVHDPRLADELAHEGTQRRELCEERECLMRAIVESALLISLQEQAHEATLKGEAQHIDAHQEGPLLRPAATRMDPAPLLGIPCPGSDEYMGMRMQTQIRSPGVQHR